MQEQLEAPNLPESTRDKQWRGRRRILPSFKPKDDLSFTRLQKLALVSAILLYVVVRFRNIASVCFDGDEIFSYALSQMKWGDLFQAAVRDSVHPPLFYCLLKIWSAMLGNSLFAVRALPILFSVLSLVPLSLLCRELSLSAWETTYAFLLTAVNPLLIFYSIQLRMYSLLLLMSTLSLLIFLYAKKSSGWSYWIALTGINVVLVYSHYYGCFVVFLEACCILAFNRSNFWKAMASSLVSAVAFSPWMILVMRAVKEKGGLGGNLGWIVKPTSGDFLWFLMDQLGMAELLFINRWFLLALATVWGAILWMVVRTLRNSSPSLRSNAYILLVFALAPIGISYFASNVLSLAIWGHRHLLFTILPFAMLVAMVMKRASGILRPCLAGILLVTFGHGIIYALQSDDRRVSWDQIVIQMERVEIHSQASRPTASNTQHGAMPVVPLYGMDATHYASMFFLDSLKEKHLSILATAVDNHELPQLSQTAEMFHPQFIREIWEAHGQHFWFGYAVPNWKQSSTPEQMFENKGCRIGADLDGIDRNHHFKLFPVWCP